VAETPRVYMSMLIETNQAPEDVQLAVLASLSDRYKIVHNSVQGFNGDDDPMPDITFIVCPVRGLLKAFVNDEAGAEEFAKREGAALVSWTADADYRGEVTA
jgi:hypothetical protein